jgi:spore germination cell wall hydrolase CwlJ-like protein
MIDIAPHDMAPDRRVLAIVVLICVTGVAAALALMSGALSAEPHGSDSPGPVVRIGLVPSIPTPDDQSALAPISASEAEQRNAALPVSIEPVTTAAPFFAAGANPAARTRALDCLAAAIYYEAGSEPVEGQRAVAQVVLNRVRHPSFPNSVCGVVYEGSSRKTGCQFTFTCDGSRARTPTPARLARVRRIASAALAGHVYAPVGLATHYHTDRVFPYWAQSLDKVGNVGAHIFYRWQGVWGRTAAFRQIYSGEERVPELFKPEVATDAGLASDVRANETLAIAGFERRVIALKGSDTAIAEPTIEGTERWIIPMDPGG